MAACFRTLFVPFLLLSSLVHGQPNQVLVQSGIRLPNDSVERQALLSDTHHFLQQAKGPNQENTLVKPSEKNETFALLDELKTLEKSGRFKSDTFYRPFLTNAVPLQEHQYCLQLSYIGTHENTPYLRASIELIAEKVNDGFVFSSPLARNTAHWKSQTVGGNLFHFKDELNVEQATQFGKLSAFYDSKLGSENQTTEFYCCQDLLELQKLLGVTYKIDYNGRNQAVFSAVVGNKKLVLLGNANAHFDHFDTHDLWHDRLSLVVPRRQVNKPVDEGCAYLYGGSWGFTWAEIFQTFNEQVAVNKKVDWLAMKETPVYFKTGKYSNSADYIVNALLVKKIEQEHGFEGVWKLLNVGPFEKGNEKYFETLAQLTGITKSNYNKEIWKLIREEQQL